MIDSQKKTSPMMMQWHACKEAAKTAVLFFRMGDFYEAFYEDAILLSKELDLTLTKRQEIPMAGIPHHSAEGYIDKLIAKGYRVAVAEQTEDPKTVKGLVNREVVRVVTPATVINSSLLNEKSNNFFVAIHESGSTYGIALLDLSTTEFALIEFDSVRDLCSEIYRLRPSEVLVSKKFAGKNSGSLDELKHAFTFLLSEHDDWHFEKQNTYQFLLEQFRVHNLEGFGLKNMTTGICAGGALLQYIRDELCISLESIKEIKTYSTSNFMMLDTISQRNLELTESLNDGSKKNTLLQVLDKTCTPMGSRLIKHWIKQPLMSPGDIQIRQDAVERFHKNSGITEKLVGLLESVRDLERLIMKVISGYAGPRDLVALKSSFENIPEIRTCLFGLSSDSGIIFENAKILDPLESVMQLISRTIVDEPPLKIADGGLIRDGVSPELDELRLINNNSKQWLANYQNELRESTGIKTLKVGFNRMFGYFIEVSKGQVDKMPSFLEKRQTLVNGARYITPELKEYEVKVLTAEERISALETEIFHKVREEIGKHSSRIIEIARAIAVIDVLRSFGEVARAREYVRPVVNDSYALKIDSGRHPVIEASSLSEKFVANDSEMDNEKNRLYLITGPNMAGKSTYLRQVALITIMAQMGSFVPASAAEIGIVDKIFTRIGAGDDLSKGQSTFMVEMTETANILHNASDRSLVILDEIGRGTGTYDGISIARSVAEYLLNTPGKQAKTLFATHYKELTTLEKIHGAVNYTIAVQETKDSVIFLRKIIRGEADKSYGIHVGRLAGLPQEVLARAQEILEYLESRESKKIVFDPPKPKIAPKKKQHSNEYQLSFFS